MKRRIFLSFPALLAAQSTPSEDPLLKVMQGEMERAKSLSVVGGQPVYYMECSVDEVHSFSAQASLGGLINSRSNYFRLPGVGLRIGNMDFDNTNYLLSDLFQGTRYDQSQLPLENNLSALRHNFWLALDRAYKTAIEAIGRKKAALRNVTQSETLPDFSAAPPAKLLEPVAAWNLNEEIWKNLAKEWSLVFRNHPDIYDSTVDVEISRDTLFYANTYGAEVRMTEDLFYVRARANSQAPDGMVVRDSITVMSMGANQAPARETVRAEIAKVAANIDALRKAPAADSYNGPVLFEGLAAAQLFAEMIGGQAATVRQPVVEPGRPSPVSASDFEGRRGSRVLPTEFTVVDDPTQKTYRGRPLMGYYPVDQEGVKPEPVVLVEKGNWAGYLATRQPTRETKASNGHARLKGNFGANQAYISNLFVKAEGGVEPAALRQRFLEMLQQRNKPYGLLLRKLDFPSTGGLTELRQMFAGAGSRPVPFPLLAYKIYPDGREELVRGLRFRNMSSRALRDIIATGNDETQFDFIGNGAPLALVGAGNYIVGVSVVAPSVIFDDLELDRPQTELPKLPAVPPPPFSSI
ncbi:MAG: metallopeptidase TldD-related protein [Bryobacter sp.]|nr:metallopeptidase TldD-related protein [Bryobacter sp.]